MSDLETRLAAGERPPEGKAWVHVTMFPALTEVWAREVNSLRSDGILASVEAETPVPEPEPEPVRLGLHPSHAWIEAEGDWHGGSQVCTECWADWCPSGCGQDDEALTVCAGHKLPHAAHNPYPAVPIVLRRLKSGPPIRPA